MSTGLAGLASPAWAGTGSRGGSTSSPQPISKADANPGGANGQCPGGPYCSTRDGSPSLNGNGKGAAVGKPCAGCVGKADNKNPPGQMPNGSDHNNGYECDGNHGIGRSNPAHTGCTPPVTPPVVHPPVCNPPVVHPPVVNPPVVNPPEGGTPVVNPPVANPPVVNPPVVNKAVSGPAVSGQPQILGELLVAPEAASQVTHPLPASAAAGEADTSGQLVAGGFAAFAAFLALGTGIVLRRRHGDA